MDEHPGLLLLEVMLRVLIQGGEGRLVRGGKGAVLVRPGRGPSDSAASGKPWRRAG